MQLSHDPVAIDAVFDEGNLVSCAGLAPVMALGERAGLSELLAEHLSVSSPNAPTKVTSLLAGMVAGVDSIEDMNRPDFRGGWVIPRAGARGRSWLDHYSSDRGGGCLGSSRSRTPSGSGSPGRSAAGGC